jgi:hypothetical protein
MFKCESRILRTSLIYLFSLLLFLILLFSIFSSNFCLELSNCYQDIWQYWSLIFALAPNYWQYLPIFVTLYNLTRNTLHQINRTSIYFLMKTLIWKSTTLLLLTIVLLLKKTFIWQINLYQISIENATTVNFSLWSKIVVR